MSRKYAIICIFVRIFVYSVHTPNMSTPLGLAMKSPCSQKNATANQINIIINNSKPHIYLMRKTCMTLLLACLAAAPVSAQSIVGGEPLKGFYYGDMAEPTGWEWQSPDSLSYNKLQPHAWFFSFKDVDQALNVLPEHSSYWQSLNGTWKFNWASNPDVRPKNFYETTYDVSGWDDVTVPMNWNVTGIQKDGSLKYGTPIYSNQRVIFKHSVRVGDWKGGVMRPAPEDWVTHKDRNEVGSYRRTFTVPEEWDGREVILNFDGVDNFFYVYVNGQYVGFATNSRNLAAFDITKHLVKGENMIAVEVYRHSMASFIESQDMMRLPGIFRDVYLTSKPEQAQIYDVVAIPEYDDSYTQATLNMTTHLTFGKKMPKGLKLRYTLYENPLYGDAATKKVEGVQGEFAVNAEKGMQSLDVKGSIQAGDKVKPWNAECPQRYTLVGELLDKKGRTIETVSTIIGFREIEIKETAAKDDEFGLAGRYYYLNGKPVKMKGVNRHETSAFYGHALTREWMEKEVMIMKRGNINHVRNSHYPDAPYWYYLCDKYGIMLEDEANIESHQYYYGEASMSHVKEFLNAHIARNLEMVHARINSPSICIWSLGNEAGPGDNFVKAYQAIKKFDKSRPVQYERNNHIVDMGSNQYPSIPWVQGAVKGEWDLVYPFHISEYAHSMGNACGNLADYWEAMESTNFFVGGAIWEWIDHGLLTYTKEGTPFMAYGGDFGDKPNDGMFCMDGVMMADLTPKAQYYEVKKVYQNVGVKATNIKKGKIEIFNKNYFEPLKGYQIVWSLWKDGVCVKQNAPLQGPRMLVAPRSKQVFKLGYDMANLDPASEYFVKVQFLLANDMPWAKKGYVQMEEQLFVQTASQAAPALLAVAKGTQPIEKTESDGHITLKGNDFTVMFDQKDGSISTLIYGSQNIITPGKGPKLDAFRAPTDNDAGIGYPNAWFKNGLYDLQHKVLSWNAVALENSTYQLTFTVESQGQFGSAIGYGNTDRPNGDVYTFDRQKQKLGEDDFKFTSNLVYTVYPDGSIEVNSAISATNPSVVLPRIGYALELPAGLKNYNYYGRGPINNYNDRLASQFIELHTSTVAEQGIVLAKPQSMGNREDVRWCALTNDRGAGAVFIADSVMSASALPWSQQELTLAEHPYQLPKSSGTHLHLDAKVTGLGGASCGQGGPLGPDRVMSTNYDFGFAIRPINIGRAMPSIINETANVSLSGELPINMQRSRAGVLTLTTPAKDRTIMYSINPDQQPKAKAKKGKKAEEGTVYTEPINLREGGKVVAWYKENPTLKVEMTYKKIDVVPLEVVFCSSDEPQGGQAARFVDNDPSTFWHTAYSITLTKHPHWVDFDAAEVKTMKGFSYTPRPGGGNGNVKDYEIFVSQDGKEWGEAIVKGTFPNNAEVKKVMFEKPVKARYIRFRALSEQNGQEYASGAEFTLIAD